DLRFVFAAFKINSHLESIGDSAKGVARLVLEMEKSYDEKLLTDVQLLRMYELADTMIEDNVRALRADDTSQARLVFQKDAEMDAINKKAIGIVAGHMTGAQAEIIQLINLITITRRLERVGDLSANIAEEIIFYVEAKVLKHEKAKIPGS
ncbi:MAG TPA: PhoU domain-containing protein, partial [Chitinophagales bacterium]|nr:PhoU domain-containing protein [Chitinophagales bacterium]